jgi:hypothetical protein
MWLELAKPVTLLASVLSLLVVMRAAFFGPETDFDQRMLDSLLALLLSGGVSLISGLVFLESGRESNHFSRGRVLRIAETFPIQIFCWTTGIMAVVFLIAWYLETHCIFYRDVHR